MIKPFQELYKYRYANSLKTCKVKKIQVIMIKNPSDKSLDNVNEVIEQARKKQIIQLYTEDKSYNGRHITINDKKVLNFGSCSYLGLEMHEKLKFGGIEAIENYGVQFSCSTAYLSCTLYNHLEGLLKSLFNWEPLLVTATTTLGHISVINTIFAKGDFIVMDQQVHGSVQAPALNSQLKGTVVTVIKHNNLEMLEEKIIKMGNQYDRVWYLIDGVYSMYGDYAPVKKIKELMERYPKLHLYVDDAHGMSWTGEKGIGYVLSQIGMNERMILATSLCKAFASAGACFLFPNEETKQRVRNCGSTLTFSGPIQPPMLGVAVASAKLHLEKGFVEFQNQLKQKIEYCHKLLIDAGLPVLSEPSTPLFFVGLGLTRMGYNVIERMQQSGFNVNLGIFPAVPEKCTGVRFTITNHLQLSDIRELVESLRKHFIQAMIEENRTIADLDRGFKDVPTYISPNIAELGKHHKPTAGKFRVQHEASILSIDKKVWNRIFRRIGANDWEELKFFEETFTGNPKPEHNWKFSYFIVWEHDEPVLATFCTTTITKADMFAPAAVSEELEKQRKEKYDAYHLSAVTLMTGCLLSIGQHIYIDRKHTNWRKGLLLLLDQIWEQQKIDNATTLCLRDFDENDHEIRDFFLQNGFVKLSIPDTHILTDLSFQDEQEFLHTLSGSTTKSTKARKDYIRRKVIRNESKFEVEIVRSADEETINHYYKLYKNISDRSYEIVGFPLSEKFFKDVMAHSNWEMIELKLTPEYDNRKDRKAVGIALSYVTDHYNFLLTGMDYQFRDDFDLYPQILWQTIKRARELKLKSINLGLTASQNKRKFGSKVIKQAAYFQLDDNIDALLVGLVPNK